MLILLYGMLSPLLSGLGMLFMGELVIISNSFMITFISYIGAIVLPARGIYSLISKKIHKEKITLISIVLTAIEIVIALFIIIMPSVSFKGFIYAIEIYLTLVCTIKAIDALIYCKNKQWRKFTPSLVQSIALVQLFFALVFCPDNIREYIVLAGICLFFNIYGICQICDFLIFVSKNKRFQHVLSSIRIALPDFISIFLTQRLTESAFKKQTDNSKKNYNVEVLFQVTDSGIGTVGHCELCYKGKTITYGNYNPQDRHLFKTIGEGIVFKAEKEMYIKWEIEQNKKQIISYRLNLTPDEINLLEEEISSLQSCMEKWTPDGKSGDIEFADRLSKQGDVEFYRITKGCFKTYFIPTINCVSMTGKFLEKTNIGKLYTIGLATPGAFMHRLHKMYQSGSELVVAREVYG